MKSKKKDNDKLITSLLIAATVTILVILVVYIISPNSSDSEDGDGSDEGDKGRGEVYIPNGIPSYTSLSEVMNDAVKDLYGDKYEDLMVVDNGDYVHIPNTQITFNRNEVGDALDTMAVTAMAFVRNPYAKHDDHPVPIKTLTGEAGDTVRTLPDGTSIDLSQVVQNYTDLKIYVDRQDPSSITVKGYCNGEYFTEGVSLLGLYELYY